MVPVGAIQPNCWNVNQGDLGSIVESVRVNRFYGAILAQKSSGKIIAGEHRWRAAQSEGLLSVPVIWMDVDDETAKRIMLADNRTTRLGLDDPAALAELLQGLPSIEGTGFDADALNDLLSDLGQAGTVGLTDEDAAPEVPATPVTVLGDLWLLGEHRVLCGDSTSVDAVERLMDGQKAGLMATDPPYGVALRLEDNHEASNAAKGIDKKYRHFETIMGDNMDGPKLQSFLESVFVVAMTVLHDNAAWYLWHAQLTQGFFAAAAAAAAQLLVHRQIIWVKPHFVFGHGDYHWQHELCFYGWRKGFRPPFYGERNQSTTWDLGEGGGSIRKDQHHPTQKPVELFARPISNHLKAGEICYEPFAGSGSQIIAAEKAGVRCFALELAPQYVDVICKRWQEFAGKAATLDGDGRTFDEVSAERINN